MEEDVHSKVLLYWIHLLKLWNTSQSVFKGKLVFWVISWKVASNGPSHLETIALYVPPEGLQSMFAYSRSWKAFNKEYNLSLFNSDFHKYICLCTSWLSTYLVSIFLNTLSELLSYDFTECRVYVIFLPVKSTDRGHALGTYLINIR